MSSNISGLLDDRPPLWVVVVAVLDEPPVVPALELSLLLVEYFVEVLDDCSVATSVPKSVQLLHTSSWAPSTLIVVGDEVVAPHISHWTIHTGCMPVRINDAP
jgi:hypothetical protein